MKYFKVAILFSAITIVSVITGCTSQSNVVFSSTHITFDNPKSTTFTVDVADTIAEQTLGLGDTTMLPVDHGMIFIYPKTNMYEFWMKDVEYPIDIIWIKDLTVVDITSNIPPEARGTTYANYAHYSPNSPVNMVLEVGAGIAKQEGIAVGQHLTKLDQNP